MKKFIVLMMIAYGFASCEKAEDPVEDPIPEAPTTITNKALNGSWDITSYTIDGTEVFGPGKLVTAATYTFTMTEDAIGTLNTKVTALGSENEGNATYVISGEDGDMITLTDVEDGEKTEGTLTIDNGVMIFTYDNDEDKPEVVKASKK